MLKQGQLPILLTNIVVIIAFSIFFIMSSNYEFLFYVLIVIGLISLIVFTNKKVNYPNDVLWGLTIWSCLHLAGGGINIGGTRLYDMMLIPITENILRYDQVIHIFGFGVATLVMYTLMSPSLKEYRMVSLSIVIVMAGMGAGALNEVIEFAATLLDAANGVGGYVNASLDLISNMIGALIALSYIITKELKRRRK